MQRNEELYNLNLGPINNINDDNKKDESFQRKTSDYDKSPQSFKDKLNILLLIVLYLLQGK